MKLWKEGSLYFLGLSGRENLSCDSFSLQNVAHFLGRDCLDFLFKIFNDYVDCLIVFLRDWNVNIVTK